MQKHDSSQSRAPVCAVVVPLKGFQVVSGELGEGVDQVSTQRRIDVLREELAAARPVLGPVGVVAHDSSTAVGYKQWNIVD